MNTDCGDFATWHRYLFIAHEFKEDRYELFRPRGVQCQRSDSGHGDFLVRVTHSGLAELPVARKDYSGGWTGVLQDLKKFVEK